MTTFSDRANNVDEASFVIVWTIACAKRLYGGGEFIKTNLEDVLKGLDHIIMQKCTMLFRKFPSRDTQPKDA